VGISDELPALLQGTPAYADVISIQDQGRDAYYAHLQIPRVGPSTTVRLERYRRQRPLQVGQRVKVAYTRSNNGAQAVPLNSTARWPGSLFYSGLGAFMLWLSQRRAQVVHNERRERRVDCVCAATSRVE